MGFAARGEKISDMSILLDMFINLCQFYQSLCPYGKNGDISKQKANNGGLLKRYSKLLYTTGRVRLIQRWLIQSST